MKAHRIPSSEMSAERDDLEDYIAEQTAQNPDFPRLMADAADRKRLLRELARARVGQGLSQTNVAAAMGTSASAVARLEAGTGNPTMATLQRFAAATGSKVAWRLDGIDGSSQGTT